MNYTAAGTHNRHFELQDEYHTALGKLDYTSWFTANAEIALNNGETYSIDRNNIWHTGVHILKDGVAWAKLVFNWKGQIVINMENGSNYLLKHEGLLHRRMILTNSDAQDIMVLRQYFNWQKFSFTYNIETDDNHPEGKDMAFILMLVYCGNWAQQSSAV